MTELRLDEVDLELTVGDIARQDGFDAPMESAARIALGTVLERIPHLDSVRRIRFVLYDHAALEVHRRVLDELRGGTDD